MQQTGFQQSFNVGELSADAWSRSELAHHSKGCLLAYNMIGRPSGPMGRRNGTWFCGHPKDQAKRAVLVPFRRNTADALLLEFGDSYVRVWTVNGTPLMNGASQVEFASPYPASEVDSLLYYQSGDVIYFSSRAGTRPQTLTRTSNISWGFAPTAMNDGPYRLENGDTAHTLTLDWPGLTSSKPLFTAGHVGALFKLRPSDGNPGTRSWEPEEEKIANHEIRLSNGRVYRNVSGADVKAGNTPPVHASGTVSDGSINWEFWHDGAITVRVTSVTSATVAVVDHLGNSPAPYPMQTHYWSEAAYSNARGWPTANPVVREERLALASCAAEPDMVDFTRTAGFSPSGLDFKAGLGTGRVVDDDAVRRSVGGEREPILWLANSKSLLAGTPVGEYVITGETLEDPISPSGVVARPLSEFGSAPVPPVLAFGSVLYVAAGGETLRELKSNPDEIGGGEDFTIVASHIGARGLARLTWLKQPYNLVWVQLDDGGQASMTYHPEQRVFGWSRHGIASTELPDEDSVLGNGMRLESSCVLPGPKGRPRLFMLVSRTKGSGTQRLILRMADATDKLFLDAAELYEGAAVSSFAGLDHLAGEKVTVMAATDASATATPRRGWGQYRGRDVTGAGAVALPEGTGATKAYIGLPFISRWEGLPPDLAGPGTSMGKKIRYNKVQLVADVASARIGTTGIEGDALADTLLNRSIADVAGARLARMVHATTITGGAEYERRLFLETDDGWDLVIYALRGVADVN